MKRMPVEVYSRVAGYFRPLNQWNKGKREEYRERNELDPADVIKGITTISRGSHRAKPGGPLSSHSG